MLPLGVVRLKVKLYHYPTPKTLKSVIRIRVGNFLCAYALTKKSVHLTLISNGRLNVRKVVHHLLELSNVIIKLIKFLLRHRWQPRSGEHFIELIQICFIVHSISFQMKSPIL